MDTVRVDCVGVCRWSAGRESRRVEVKTVGGVWLGAGRRVGLDDG
jgi:hypothetical protein